MLDVPNQELATPTHGSETVMLVVDEDAVRRATYEFLKLQGYTVLEARAGLDALAIVKAMVRPSIWSLVMSSCPT